MDLWPLYRRCSFFFFYSFFLSFFLIFFFTYESMSCQSGDFKDYSFRRNDWSPFRFSSWQVKGFYWCNYVLALKSLFNLNVLLKNPEDSLPVGGEGAVRLGRDVTTPSITAGSIRISHNCANNPFYILESCIHCVFFLKMDKCRGREKERERDRARECQSFGFMFNSKWDKWYPFSCQWHKSLFILVKAVIIYTFSVPSIILKISLIHSKQR